VIKTLGPAPATFLRTAGDSRAAQAPQEHVSRSMSCKARYMWHWPHGIGGHLSSATRATIAWGDGAAAWRRLPSPAPFQLAPARSSFPREEAVDFAYFEPSLPGNEYSRDYTRGKRGVSLRRTGRHHPISQQCVLQAELAQR
jgi:hypothetical protein